MLESYQLIAIREVAGVDINPNMAPLSISGVALT